MTVRALGPGDEAAVEAFLRGFADSSTFLRSNLRAVGLAWSGRRFEGHWTARVDEVGAIAGIACHGWNGMVVVQDDAPIETVRETLARSGRRVSGLIGPREMVAAARAGLGLAEIAASLEDEGVLMALELTALVVPRGLATGAIVCRRARPDELEPLGGWRRAYRIEVMREADGDALRDSARDEIARGIELGVQYVAEEAGVVVAMTSFSATLPDRVQVGGVYTPPAARGRGHAQAAVAGSLLDARARGVTRAMLFADRGNPASTTAYRRIGFVDGGRFALVMFAAPVDARLA